MRATMKHPFIHIYLQNGGSYPMRLLKLSLSMLPRYIYRCSLKKKKR